MKAKTITEDFNMDWKKLNVRFVILITNETENRSPFAICESLGSCYELTKDYLLGLKMPPNKPIEFEFWAHYEETPGILAHKFTMERNFGMN